MKVVVDARTIVSAYTRDGEARTLWQKCLDRHPVSISPEIFAEVERELRKAEFHLVGGEVRAILADVLERCRVVRLPLGSEDAPPPGEPAQHLPLLAREVAADVIVTEDPALSSTGNAGGVRIVTVAEFLGMVSEGENAL